METEKGKFKMNENEIIFLIKKFESRLDNLEELIYDTRSRIITG